MNDKFDKVMSKVGLFLGGVVVTMVAVVAMGTISANKERQIMDKKIFKALEKSLDESEKVINQEEA